MARVRTAVWSAAVVDGSRLSRRLRSLEPPMLRRVCHAPWPTANTPKRRGWQVSSHSLLSRCLGGVPASDHANTASPSPARRICRVPKP
eukprot:scaffold683_cov423-Prasinococcus_capsulatus_cf.AAC.7